MLKRCVAFRGGAGFDQRKLRSERWYMLPGADHLNEYTLFVYLYFCFCLTIFIVLKVFFMSELFFAYAF